eukprot:495432_1
MNSTIVILIILIGICRSSKPLESTASSVTSSGINGILKRSTGCGDTINDYIANETHYYRFIINNAYTVRIDSCLTDTDISINIIQQFDGLSVSYTYCDNGDSCGKCSNSDINLDNTENFTIPIMKPSELYFIMIQSKHEYGPYQINIECASIEYVVNRNILTGDMINNSFDYPDQSHFYSFMVSQDSGVSFRSCYSDIDINMFIYDELWNDISSQYCPDGNHCGKCYNIVKANASENFMIPFMEFKKQYYILVH